MVQKIDSTRNISRTIPLSVVSRPENNGNNEMFSTDYSRTNVDEFNFSNGKKDIPEEQNNKKKKWLIAAGITERRMW